MLKNFFKNNSPVVFCSSKHLKKIKFQIGNEFFIVVSEAKKKIMKKKQISRMFYTPAPIFWRAVALVVGMNGDFVFVFFSLKSRKIK